MRRPYDAVKRVLDVLVAAVGLLLTAPVLAAVALAVLITMGRPVLFRQARPGRHGRLFELVKFRSMSIDGEDGAPTNDGARLTPFGRWLRTTSLDELPQLWNVLRGEMSLVGPRPLLPAYLNRYTPEQFRRHEVRPGITGLQQAYGRNALSWDERFALDVCYVRQRSFGLDLRILLRTVRIVLRRDGITAPGAATAREYLGPRELAAAGTGHSSAEGPR
ncbi:sugar transferase [Micromonospora vinacea]|uniref:Lipopolysaccharide/colanic/teichoic acid biosynthesis glycosyltransferase n=1 Tax=Micromonospora vinacea TaxID=709878 RepID=A0ABS0K4Q2_9ACTN|nr:sugar transferase [Micromonospora vinacea]MBG6103495.1 lipopolysaccharide/colanic/teichoic acid biosynthesis glycosyltransferase [Micromonospora vinacea]WSZ73771.1 sugar transferase [Micromonospora sp. NBC_00860]WTA69737.1 sugar transferase [Micromonospora sp. NBC_00855]